MGQPGQQHKGPQGTPHCSKTHKRYFISPTWVCIVFLCNQCGGREPVFTARFGQIRQQLPEQRPLKQCWCSEQRSKLGVFFSEELLKNKDTAHKICASKNIPCRQLQQLQTSNPNCWHPRNIWCVCSLLSFGSKSVCSAAHVFMLFFSCWGTLLDDSVKNWHLLAA